MQLIGFKKDILKKELNKELINITLNMENFVFNIPTINLGRNLTIYLKNKILFYYDDTDNPKFNVFQKMKI